MCGTFAGSGRQHLKKPKHWENNKDVHVAEQFLLKDGAEKQKVIDAFMATLPSNVKVEQVYRIQNMALWQSYAVKRQTMQASSEEPEQVEIAWLFHGTREDIAPKIIQQGFNRSFCGYNATWYGKGAYFARDAKYSSSETYSKSDSEGIQRMFLVRVAVGSYCLGVKDALTPKEKSDNTLYDTTVDDESDPKIYVCYHDGQAYPEYLVYFRQSIST